MKAVSKLGTTLRTSSVFRGISVCELVNVSAPATFMVAPDAVHTAYGTLRVSAPTRMGHTSVVSTAHQEPAASAGGSDSSTEAGKLGESSLRYWVPSASASQFDTPANGSGDPAQRV